MKTVERFLFVGVLLVAVGSSSIAQLSYGGGAQFAAAFSSFKPDFYGTGLVFGAHGDLDFNKYLTLRLAFDYITFGADAGKLKTSAQDGAVAEAQSILGRQLTPAESNTVRTAITSVDGARSSAPSISVSALGKLPTGSIVTPYAIVGIGMTFLSFGDLNLTGDGVGVTVTDGQGHNHPLIPAGTVSEKVDSQTKFGIQFGAGSELKLSKLIRLFLEVRYNLVFTNDSNSSYFPIMVGVTFGG